MWHVNYILGEKKRKKIKGGKYHYEANEIAVVATDSPKVPIIFSVKGRSRLLIKPTSNWEWLCSRSLQDKC